MGTESTGIVAYALDCGFVGVDSDAHVTKLANDHLLSLSNEDMHGGELFKEGADGKVCTHSATDGPDPLAGLDVTDNTEVASGTRVFRCCVEMAAFEVMDSAVGTVPEKDVECRDDTEYWRQRLCFGGDVRRLKHFDYVVVYGGVSVCSPKAAWCVYEYKAHTLLFGGVRGGRVGPYSNGYTKSFSGNVWAVEVGMVVRRNTTTTKYNTLARQPR